MSNLEKYIRKDLPDEFYITRLTLKELKMDLLEALYHCQNSAEIDCLGDSSDENDEKHYKQTLPKAIKVVGKFMKKLEKNPDIEKRS